MKAELYSSTEFGDEWRVPFIGVSHLATTDEGQPMMRFDGTQIRTLTCEAAGFCDSFMISDTFSDRYWTFLMLCDLTPQERQNKWVKMRQLMTEGR